MCEVRRDVARLSQLHVKYGHLGRHRRNAIVVSGVITSICLSPGLAVLAVGQSPPPASRSPPPHSHPHPLPAVTPAPSPQSPPPPHCCRSVTPTPTPIPYPQSPPTPMLLPPRLPTPHRCGQSSPTRPLLIGLNSSKLRINTDEPSILQLLLCQYP